MNSSNDDTFIVKDWLLEQPRESVASVLKHVSSPALFHHPYAETFYKRAAVMTVYTSNKLESTLPSQISEREIYNLLDQLYDATDSAAEVSSAGVWHAEGAKLSDSQIISTTHQMTQHLRAMKFLTQRVGEPLSAETVLKTHEILMQGSVDDSGVSIKNGVLRSSACHAGTHVYPEGDPDALFAALICILGRYNKAHAEHTFASVETLITAPVRLMYDTLTLHPFENGNGRLCRLLFSFALMQVGVPFPVPLTSGHKKAHKHYMKAILMARRRGDMRELNTMALMSLECTLVNFAENVRIGYDYFPI